MAEEKKCAWPGCGHKLVGGGYPCYDENNKQIFFHSPKCRRNFMAQEYRKREEEQQKGGRK